MASSSLIASPSEFTGDIHHKDNNENIIGLSEDKVMDLWGNVEAGTSDSLMTETLHEEENSVDSSEQLPLDADGISDAGPCSDLSNSTTHREVETKDNVHNCSSDMLSSTCRSTRQRNSNKMSETNKTAARSRKTSKNMVIQGGTSGISFKIEKSQRSLTSRRERSLVWGTLENVMLAFTEYNEIPKQDIKLVNFENQRPQKRSGSKGNKRSGKSLPLEEIYRRSDNQSGRSTLKLKIGGKEVKGSPDVVVDSLACLPTIISECATEADSQISSEIPKSDDRFKLDNSTNDRRKNPHLRGDLDNANTSKRRSRAPDSARSRRRNTFDEKKRSVQKSVNNKMVNQKAFAGHSVFEEENNPVAHGDTNLVPETKNHSEPREHDELGKMNVGGHEIDDVSEKSRVTEITTAMISSELDGQISQRKAWVLCDDCQKWRCISSTLADSINETNCRWTCKDNADKAFANCSIPQEKTNAEIDAELEILNTSGAEDAYGAPINSTEQEGNQLTVAKEALWKPIVSNMFLHRKRKSQPIDEVMVCQCKRPLDGSLGCGDECLNRMLNIECVRGTCPCGDRCSNQQFQKLKYAKLEHFRCGKKGYGLQLLENVTQGKFLIEYVGEVLDLNAYEARQREYALRGQTHFYFMTLHGSEVIDACAKGNLGRFMNHSCNPNCCTEKWMVNGEVCIGLFALRDIKKGEELTFDYNYERVIGAAAKKCVCGSSQCLGYIGGDPSNTETIVQGDSDEEFPEPVMVNEVGDDCLDKTNIITRKIGGVQDNIQRSDHAVRPSDIPGLLDSKIGRSVFAIQPLVMPSKTDAPDELLSPLLPLEASLQEEDIMSKTSSSIKSVSSTVMDTRSEYMSANNKPKPSTDEDMTNIMKALPKTKSSRSASSAKKVKSHSHPVAAYKPQVYGNKLKKVLEAAVSNRLKGVEDTLNELLDADGGISRREDSTTGYLKLLLVTAASDDNVKGEVVQSTRDLSIILDALLKTRSRTVLVDIINKNGLQMLHNIMKQNRRNFRKTPIIRKLLKVLTFLAEKEILSLEHITSASTCDGVESLEESIIQLTRHNDVTIHQIARNFRDKWIPRTSRRNVYSDRDVRLEAQGGVNCNRCSRSYNGRHDHGVRHIDAMDCTTQDGAFGSFTVQFSSEGQKSRKRKSRWDKPSETGRQQHLNEFMEERKMKQQFKCRPTDQVPQADGEEMMYTDRAYSVAQPSRIDAQDVIDEAPLGFSFPLKSPWPSNDAIPGTSNHSLHTYYSKSTSEISIGCHQERYHPHLPVSYGITMALVEQLGTHHSENTDNWSAPGIPFHPCPPLPPYPRDRSNFPRPLGKSLDEDGKELQQNNDFPSQARKSKYVASTGVGNQKIRRCSSGSLGRRYFRQKKWNNWGKRPGECRLRDFR